MDVNPFASKLLLNEYQPKIISKYVNKCDIIFLRLTCQKVKSFKFVHTLEI